MRNLIPYLLLLYLAAGTISCKRDDEAHSFGQDLELLKLNTETLVLQSGNAMVAVVGAYQGRIMTSSSGGLQGKSYGWFNREKVAGGSVLNSFSSVGGEDRMWFGPEAGEYSVFFESGKAQIPENVKIAQDLNTLPFRLLSSSDTSASFGNRLSITNYQDYTFQIEIERTITIFSRKKIENTLGIELGEKVSAVGFQSRTNMENVGPSDWAIESGLLSIWDLGCFPPSPHTAIVIPTRNNMDSANIYFSPIDDSRLRIIDNILYYKGDGNYLNKIGIPARHTKPVFGSYNPEQKVLTIVKFAFTDEPLYVNSHWVYQDQPYGGDVINVFNDGITETAGPFGPFYELETSSSARELKVGEAQEHTHATFHFEGELEDLSPIARDLLGVSLNEIQQIIHSMGHM